MAETTTVDARTPTTFTITEPPPIARIMKLADAYALAAMAVSAMTLWLPKPPDNANQRSPGSVHKHARLKREFWDQLDTRRHVKLIPPPPDTPIASVTVTVEWFYPDKRWHLDDDNATRRLKPAIDWLVANGYLAGDKHGQVRWGEVVQHVGQPTPPLSTVRLTLTPTEQET